MIIKLRSTEKGITLTDKDGQDLFLLLSDAVKERINKQKDLQMQYTANKVKTLIDAHKIISFDIFDTLMTRTVAEPEMVFDMVSRRAQSEGIEVQSFRKERVKAQLESGLVNANLDEVYEKFSENTGISTEQSDRLKKIELECESDVLVPRTTIVELFRYALSTRKKVYLTTDMYLNRRDIVSLLNRKGITGYFDILDSCEYRKLKLEGLFEELVATNPGERVLHIGDSYINDCVCAEAAGVDSCLIPAGKNLTDSVNIHIPDKCTLEPDDIVIGYQTSELCNDPFINTNKLLDIGDQLAYSIGYSCMGPLLLSLVQWMTKATDIGQYDGLLLSARDGYLLEKILKKLKEQATIPNSVEIHYFYTSRKAAVAMRTDSESVINLLVDQTSAMYLPDEMLREVFCIDKERITPYDLGKYGDNRYQYVWDHFEIIKENVLKLKQRFFRYMGKEGLKLGGRYLFYDFVSSGTVQKSLFPIVPFEMDGIYYSFNGEMSFPGKLFSKFDHSNEILMANYKLMEYFMSSPEASLWGYDENGTPVLCNDDRTKEQISYLKVVHQGVLDYTDAFLCTFSLDDAAISEELTSHIITQLRELTDISHLDRNFTDDWIIGKKNSPEENKESGK